MRLPEHRLASVLTAVENSLSQIGRSEGEGGRVQAAPEYSKERESKAGWTMRLSLAWLDETFRVRAA